MSLSAEESVWSNFQSAAHTLGPTPGERERWHAGRQRYAVWVARVRTGAILERVKTVQSVLEPWIAPVAADQLHITVFVCGFPSPGGALGDDVEPAALFTQAHALAKAVPARFELSVGAANSFTSAAFLQVRDTSGSLALIRQQLAASLSQWGKQEVRFAPYMPHLTVGTYHADFPVGPIAKALHPLRTLGNLPCRLDALELVDYATNAWDAPFRTLQRVVFGQQTTVPSAHLQIVQ